MWHLYGLATREARRVLDAALQAAGCPAVSFEVEQLMEAAIVKGWEISAPYGWQLTMVAPADEHGHRAWYQLENQKYLAGARMVNWGSKELLKAGGQLGYLEVEYDLMGRKALVGTELRFFTNRLISDSSTSMLASLSLVEQFHQLREPLSVVEVEGLFSLTDTVLCLPCEVEVVKNSHQQQAFALDLRYIDSARRRSLAYGLLAPR